MHRFSLGKRYATQAISPFLSSNCADALATMELELEQKLTLIFRDTFQDRGLILRRDLTAADVPTWTSLTHVEMISAVERNFGIRFKLKEIMKMRNVGDLMDTIQAHLTAPKPS